MDITIILNNDTKLVVSGKPFIKKLSDFDLERLHDVVEEERHQRRQPRGPLQMDDD